MKAQTDQVGPDTQVAGNRTHQDFEMIEDGNSVGRVSWLLGSEAEAAEALEAISRLRIVALTSASGQASLRNVNFQLVILVGLIALGWIE